MEYLQKLFTRKKSHKKRNKKRKTKQKKNKKYSIKKFPAAVTFDLETDRFIGCGNTRKLITDTKESSILYPKILRDYRSELGPTRVWSTVFLYPYVNEHIKGNCIVDRVNCPILPIPISDTISKIFEINIKKLPEITVVNVNKLFKFKSPFSKNTMGYLGSHEPAAFAEYCQHLTGNHFIVTHSKLLEKLYKHIVKKNFKNFTNLSCLVIEMNDFIVCEVSILLSEKLWTKSVKWKSRSIHSKKPNKRIVLMRHCPGCHNVTKDVWEKRGLSGIYANCLPVTFRFLQSNKAALTKNVFLDNPESYQVGCSPSPRTLVTLCGINHSLL